MKNQALFTFFGKLNDFLPSKQKDQQVQYSFEGKPYVKDAIEAIGIPHPEVKAIFINSKPAGFASPLLHSNEVKVYPLNYPELPNNTTSLRAEITGDIKFIIDVHLGKLARSLRMLGFDVLWEQHFADHEIVDIAEAEKRIVLSRDLLLLKRKKLSWGYWLRSQDPDSQLEEVIHQFKLIENIKPFTRCMVCNGIIDRVNKEQILNQLQQKTKTYFHEFYQCISCQNVYWKGSHFDKMEKFIEKLKSRDYKF